MPPISVVIPSGMLHGHSLHNPLKARDKTSLIDGVIILVRNVVQRLCSSFRPVWYRSQQLHELFFLPNTYFQNSFMGEAVFPLLSQKHKLDEAEKN